MASSLIPEEKLEFLRSTLKSVLHLPGDVAEAGVYRGGSALVMADVMATEGKFNKLKILRLFDTFSGMPEVDSRIDLHKTGDFCDVDLESVTKQFDHFDFVGFHVGDFDVTFKASSDYDREFCFVHVDCDIYRSVKLSCEHFYTRMVSGGIMVFDDYNSPGCPGAKLAVDEFFVGKPETVEKNGGKLADSAVVIKI